MARVFPVPATKLRALRAFEHQAVVLTVAAGEGTESVVGTIRSVDHRGVVIEMADRRSRHVPLGEIRALARDDGAAIERWAR